MLFERLVWIIDLMYKFHMYSHTDHTQLEIFTSHWIYLYSHDPNKCDVSNKIK